MKQNNNAGRKYKNEGRDILAIIIPAITNKCLLFFHPINIIVLDMKKKLSVYGTIKKIILGIERTIHCIFFGV